MFQTFFWPKIYFSDHWFENRITKVIQNYINLKKTIKQMTNQKIGQKFIAQNVYEPKSFFFHSFFLNRPDIEATKIARK